MDRRKFYSLFMLIDLSWLVLLVYKLIYAIFYAIDYFSSAIDNILICSFAILISIYSLYLHYKLKSGKENLAEKIHFWIYIASVIIFSAPLIFYFIAALINPDVRSEFGFAIGIYYVGLSLVVGIISVINTVIIGSIALKKSNMA